MQRCVMMTHPAVHGNRYIDVMELASLVCVAKMGL